MPVLRTSEIVFGSLPTPTAIDATMTAKGKAGASGHHSVQLSHLANSGALMTVDPIATQDNLRRAGKLSKAEANTPSGNWPTPTCADAFTDKLKSDQQKEGPMHSVNLSQAVQIWRTPTVGMLNADRAKDPEYHARKVAKGQTITLADEVKTAEGGGSLNPDWVEWLMGWPIGWTDLKPLETDKYPPPHRWHGIPYTNESKTDKAA